MTLGFILQSFACPKSKSLTATPQLLHGVLVIHKEIFCKIFEKIFLKIISDRFLVSGDFHATFHVILHKIFDQCLKRKKRSAWMLSNIPPK